MHIMLRGVRSDLDTNRAVLMLSTHIDDAIIWAAEIGDI